jgi:hypothetical protein
MQATSQPLKQTLALIALWTMAYLIYGIRFSIDLSHEFWKRYHKPVLGGLLVNTARGIFLIRLSIAIVIECWKRYNHHLAAALNTVVLVLADAFPPFELLQLRWWPSAKLGHNLIQATPAPVIDVLQSPGQEAELPIPNPWEEPLPEQRKFNGYPMLKAPSSVVIALLPAAAPLPTGKQLPSNTQPSLIELTVRELRKLARDRNIAKYGSLTKKALIAALS